VLIAIIGVAGLAQAQESGDIERIAIPTLKDKLESGDTFLLIDVREDWELEANGAIRGAIHIPVGELEARMPDIPKDIELVFY
jgi:queuine tRNA-ribosyltransferase